jgi:hypothetical protein
MQEALCLHHSCGLLALTRARRQRALLNNEDAPVLFEPTQNDMKVDPTVVGSILQGQDRHGNRRKRSTEESMVKGSMARHSNLRAFSGSHKVYARTAIELVLYAHAK